MFIRDHFQFNRGIPNCQASGEGLTTVQHTYISATDSVADISSLDYFPDNFQEDASFVIPKDTILIIGSDTVMMVEVLTTAPVTIGTNLFTDSGPSLEVDPPIAAIDANGLVVNGDILTLEFADISHPGIVSIDTQVFHGAKTFAGNMVIRELDTDFGGTPPTKGLQIRETGSVCGIDIFNTTASSVMLYSFGSVALGDAYAAMQFSATTFGGTPKLIFTIAYDTAISIDINQEVTFPVGIKLPTVLGTPSLLSFYQLADYTTTLTNDTSTSNAITFQFVRIGGHVSISLQGAPGIATTGATPGEVYTADTVIPAAILPASFTGGQITITVAGVTKTTFWGTNPAGQLYIYFDNNSALNYPAATSITFGPGSLTYSKA